MLARVLFLAVTLSAHGRGAQQWLDVDSWRPPPQTLSGAIETASGAAIEGAELRLWTREREARLHLGSATSDAHGRFALNWARPRWDMEQERATLVVSAPRFATTVIENVFLIDASFDLGPLTLHEPVELRGFVRSGDGAPIAGARVYGVAGPVQGVRPELWDSAPIAVTDASGAYICRTLPPGRVTLSAGASGFADAPDSALTLEVSGSNTQDFVLAVAPTRTLTVRSKFDKSIAAVEVGPPGDASAMAERFGYLSTHAFWRGPWRGDERGVVRLDGVAAHAELDVRIRARGYRDKFAALNGERFDAQLDSVTWIEVSAVRSTGSAPVELHLVSVRDGGAPKGMCGDVEDAAWSHVFADSPAVEMLAPERWRIAWNSPECIVSGGAPSTVVALASDGAVAACKLHVDGPGSTVSSRLEFDAPTSVIGIVRDSAGKPVSLPIGTQLGFGRPCYISTTSDALGRFTFTQLGAGRVWLNSCDPRWELGDGVQMLDLAPGAHLTGVELVVRERRPQARSGVRGTLRIDGRTPSRAVLLAIEGNAHVHVPNQAPAALIWTDREGRFEHTGTPGVSVHVVPQQRLDFDGHGWIDFGDAFPRHGSRWPLTITLPDAGVSELELELPAESAWSSLAPPHEDR